MNKSDYEGQKFESIQESGRVIENSRYLDCEFINCSFEDCRLKSCSFSGCAFYQCEIIGLGAENSQIQEAEFRACQIVGVHWGEILPDNRFTEPVRTLEECLLKYNTFTGMNFKKFRFSGTDILDSMFAECRLAESSFLGCRLERTEFYKCDMRKADFREALGYRIDILSNRMQGARFSFPEAIQLLTGLGIKID